MLVKNTNPQSCTRITQESYSVYKPNVLIKICNKITKSYSNIQKIVLSTFSRLLSKNGYYYPKMINYNNCSSFKGKKSLFKAKLENMFCSIIILLKANILHYFKAFKPPFKGRLIINGGKIL